MNSSRLKTNGKLDLMLVFRILFYISVLMTTTTYISHLNIILMPALFILGVVVLIKQVIIKKEYKKLPLYQYLIIFLALSIPGAFIGIFKNIFALPLSVLLMIFASFYMFIVLAMQNNKPQIACREIVLTAKITVYFTGVVNALGFLLFFIFRSQIWVFGQRLLVLENRYIGMYYNPNSSGYLCFFAIVCILLLRNKLLCKNAGVRKMKKRLALPLGIMNFVSIALSASYGAVMIILVFVCTLLTFGVIRSIIDRKIGDAVLKIGAVLAVCAIIFAVFTACKMFASFVVSSDPLIKIEAIEPTKEQIENELHTQDGQITFEHVNAELGSGRIDLYLKALEQSLKSPLFGFGIGGMLLSGIRTNFCFDTFEAHNGYITLLASVGLFAFLVISYVVVRWFLKMLSFAVKETDKKMYGCMQICVAFLFSAFVYALVEPSLLYYPIVSVSTLWFMLSAAFVMMKQSKDYDGFECGRLLKKAERLLSQKFMKKSEK